MWADLSLRCWTPTHMYWVMFALATMALFTFGIPLFFAVILYSNHRKLVLQTPQCQVAFSRHLPHICPHCV